MLSIITDGILRSPAVSAGVIEGCLDRDEAELSLIKVVAIHPEVVILLEFQVRAEAMDESSVPIVVPFGNRKGVAIGAHSAAGALEGFKRIWRYGLEIGHL